MAIETECPSCGKGYRVKDELDGRKIRCKQCDTPFKVKDLTALEEDAWDDEYGDDKYGDDEYGSEPDSRTASAPAAMPSGKKKRSGGSSGSRKASAKNTSSGKPAWMMPVGVLGILAGVGITGFGIWGFMEGHRKSGKATLVGVFMTIGAVKWVFSSADDE